MSWKNRCSARPRSDSTPPPGELRADYTPRRDAQYHPGHERFRDLHSDITTRGLRTCFAEKMGDSVSYTAPHSPKQSLRGCLAEWREQIASRLTGHATLSHRLDVNSRCLPGSHCVHLLHVLLWCTMGPAGDGLSHRAHFVPQHADYGQSGNLELRPVRPGIPSGAGSLNLLNFIRQ
jgi:hypothetical protein